MSKFQYKNEVFKLRRQGWSLNDIAEHLSLSKSTVSLWCKEIKLTKSQVKKLYEKMVSSGHKGRMMGAMINRKKKQDNQELALKWANNSMEHFSLNDLLYVGISLYWAEGSKSDKHQLCFVNSDPNMILFMYYWFQNVFGVNRNDFILRLSINEIHRYREDEVLSFWVNLLNSKKSCFRKTVFIKTRQKKVYENHNRYYGLLSLRLKKSSVIKYKILALVNVMRQAGVAQVVRAYHS